MLARETPSLDGTRLGAATPSPAAQVDPEARTAEQETQLGES